MKKYIILLGAIRNVGGAQVYTANKLKYMEEKGWEPHAFFFVDGEITINYLLRFKNNYIPELQNEIKYSTAQQIANAVSIIKETEPVKVIKPIGEEMRKPGLQLSNIKLKELGWVLKTEHFDGIKKTILKMI